MPSPAWELIWECASWFKHPTFREEKEWRLVLPQDERGITEPPALPRLVRLAPHAFIPYVQLSMHEVSGRLPIAEIVTGPSPRPELKTRRVRVLVEQAGGAPIDLVSSGVPLRV